TKHLTHPAHHAPHGSPWGLAELFTRWGRKPQKVRRQVVRSGREVTADRAAKGPDCRPFLGHIPQYREIALVFEQPVVAGSPAHPHFPSAHRPTHERHHPAKVRTRHPLSLGHGPASLLPRLSHFPPLDRVSYHNGGPPSQSPVTCRTALLPSP